MSTLTRTHVQTLNQRRATEAALRNEMVTRQRVDILENLADAQGTEIRSVQKVLTRDFWGRLRWLLLGR
jgi:hypothetical protein